MTYHFISVRGACDRQFFWLRAYLPFYILFVSEMCKCVICGEIFTQTNNGKNGRKHLVIVLSKVYNVSVPDRSCIKQLFCSKCQATCRRLLEQRKRARQPWKTLCVQFNLPATLIFEVSGCSNCQVPAAVKRQPNAFDDTQHCLNLLRVDLEKL